MDGTILQQGRFTSTGAAKTLQIRSDVDWMRVYNTTIAAGNQTTAVGVEYYWQRGFPAGAQWEYLKSNAANAANLSQYLTTGGFTLVDTSSNPLGALNNGSTGVSAISNATPPVVTVGSTTGIAAGDVVRLYNITNAQQVGGMDFTVGINTLNATTFDLSYVSTFGAGIGAAGNFRVVKYSPLYYPRRRFVSAITAAASAVVTMTVTHGFTVGQEVRFVVPAGYGMTEMNGLLGTITAVNTTTNTITVDIDSSAFTAFTFVINTVGSPAEVVPVGEDTATALSSSVSILGDATENQGYIGMILAAGANSPAGATNDVIYWVAGKSFSVSNS